MSRAGQRIQNMRCPELKELLEPPKEKAGWPWTEVSNKLFVRIPDGRPWPTNRSRLGLIKKLSLKRNRRGN